MFEPLQVRPMTVKNRITAPPHAALLGNIIGTEDGGREVHVLGDAYAASPDRVRDAAGL